MNQILATKVLVVSCEPGESLVEVAEKLNRTVSRALKSGGNVVSIQPHVDVVDGASRTVGYTILMAKYEESPDMPMVIAVNT